MVWAILLLALALRLGAAAVLTDTFPAGSDEQSYVELAHSIEDGDAFGSRYLNPEGGPTAALPAGYPYFLAAVFEATGGSVAAARVVNALLGTAAVALLGWVAWRIWQRRRVAVAVLATAAVYPPLVVIGAPLLTEPLFLALMLAAFAAAIEYRRAPQRRWLIAAGLLAGAAALTKNVGVIAAAGIAVMLLPAGRPSLRSLRAPATFAVIAGLVIAPWVIRNLSTFDEFTFTNTELGFSLAGAYNDLARDDPQHLWRSPYDVPSDRAVLVDRSIDESEASHRLQSRALDYATAHPGYTAALVADNAQRILELRLHGPDAIDSQLTGFAGSASSTTTFKVLFRLDQLAFLVLAGLALVAVARGALRRLPWPIAVALAITLIPPLVITGGMRFRLPFDLLLLLLAGPALVWFFDEKLRPVRPSHA
jgi:4-amino-4-deoxy-L-arabinose transferase-like glycosyltransferase